MNAPQQVVVFEGFAEICQYRNSWFRKPWRFCRHPERIQPALCREDQCPLGRAR